LAFPSRIRRRRGALALGHRDQDLQLRVRRSGRPAGCATTPPIEVVADSFCLASKKITWVPVDTKLTIDQVVKHNARIDAACGYPGKVAAK